MKRTWREIRFFRTDEDGKRYPTILFWMFLFLGLLIVGSLAASAIINAGQDAEVAAALTKTVTPTVTETRIPTNTPIPPSQEPPTPDPHLDPANWEFETRVNVDGDEYLDFQDWQKGIIITAFENFFNLYLHNPNGYPGWSEIEPIVTGDFVNSFSLEYYEGQENGSYVYFVEELTEYHPVVILEQNSTDGMVRARVILHNNYPDGFWVFRKDWNTNENISEGYLPWDRDIYIMIYEDGRWKVESWIFEGMDGTQGGS